MSSYQSYLKMLEEIEYEKKLVNNTWNTLVKKSLQSSNNGGGSSISFSEIILE
jgi:hypothetical protein